MNLSNVTFAGPPVDDPEILAALPSEFRGVLLQLNGFIQFHGGLHIRGACREPLWHSIREAWHGATAFHLTYPNISPDEAPFAQDCVGDQFLLRGGSVIRLRTETGEIDPLNLALMEFFQAVQTDPVKFLGLQPLMRFQTDGGKMEPGQLLSVYPPFCTKEAAAGVSLRAIKAQERLAFLADFYRQLRDLKPGQKFQVKIVP